MDKRRVKITAAKKLDIKLVFFDDWGSQHETDAHLIVYALIDNNFIPDIVIQLHVNGVRKRIIRTYDLSGQIRYDDMTALLLHINKIFKSCHNQARQKSPLKTPVVYRETHKKPFNFGSAKP